MHAGKACDDEHKHVHMVECAETHTHTHDDIECRDSHTHVHKGKECVEEHEHTHVTECKVRRPHCVMCGRLLCTRQLQSDFNLWRPHGGCMSAGEPPPRARGQELREEGL